MNQKEFNSLNSEDLGKYFESTIVRAKSDTFPEQFVDINSIINDDTIQIRVGSKLVYISKKDLIIDFDFPESGLYNSHCGVIEVHRRPRRVAKKGICYDTLSIAFAIQYIVPDKFQEIVVNKGMMYVSNDFNKVFLSPKYYPLAESMSLIGKKTNLTLAINKKFMLSLGIWSTSPTLWYKLTPIGEVKGNTISMINPLFFQEVKDEFLKFDVLPSRS